MHTCIHASMHTCIHARSSGGSGGGERGAASLAQPGYMPTRAVAAAAVNGQLWRRQSAGPQEPPRGLGREGGDGAALKPRRARHAPFIRCSARASGPHSAGLRSSLRHARADCPGARLRRLGVRALLRNGSCFSATASFVEKGEAPPTRPPARAPRPPGTPSPDFA